MRRARRVIAAVLGAAAAIAPVQAAEAAPVIRQVAGSNWPIGAYERKSDTVYCPAGMKAVGGGTDNNSGGDVWMETSEPTSDGTGWRIVVRNAAQAQLTYRGWAMCASGVTNYRIDWSQQSIAGWDSQPVYSYCALRSPLAGGFRADAGRGWAGVQLSVSMDPAGPGVTSTVTNLAADPIIARSNAVCGDGFGTLSAVSGAGATVRAGRAIRVTAQCPAGKTLVSGSGWSPQRRVYLVESQPIAADTWRVTLYNHESADAAVYAQAVCAG